MVGGSFFAPGGRSAAVCACLLERLLLRVAPLFYPYYLLPRSFSPGLARAVMGSAGGVMSLRSMLHHACGGSQCAVHLFRWTGEWGFLVGLIQLCGVFCVAWLRPRPAAPSSGTGVSVVNKLALPAFVLLLAARSSMGTSRQTHVFTRTLDAHVPAIYPHPRCPCTRNLPAPSFFLPAIYPHPRFFYPQFTRTLVFFTRNLPAPSFFLPAIYPHPWHPPPVTTQPPAKPFARAYPRPARPVSPLVHGTRGTRRPHATRTRYSTRTRTVPVPVAPAARHYPATRETLRPCIPATRAPRVPVSAWSPWHPPPVATQPPAKPFARAYPPPAHPESPLPYPRPCVARPRGARDPRRPLPRAFSSPQCPPPVATQPPVPAPVPIPIAGLTLSFRTSNYVEHRSFDIHWVLRYGALAYLHKFPNVRVTVRSPLSDTPTVFHKFHFNMTLERKKQTPLLRLSAGPSVVNSGHGPDRSLARARARPPMRAVPQCRTRVSSRRSSGYQEPQWVTRGLSALHKQPRPPLRCDKDKAAEKPIARHVGNGMEGASRVMGTLARNSFHNE